jgi:ADP-heptose:LPS heptosyltransferase
LVDKIEIQKLIDVIAETKLLLVADGGVMHMGVALFVPQILSLFIKGIPPELRIPPEYRSLSITSQTGLINDISTLEVLNKVQLAFSGDGIVGTDVLDMRHE